MRTVPLFNLPPNHPDWLYWQRHCYLITQMPTDSGSNCPNLDPTLLYPHFPLAFSSCDEQDYTLIMTEVERFAIANLDTLRHLATRSKPATVNVFDQQTLTVCGSLNCCKWVC